VLRSDGVEEALGFYDYLKMDERDAYRFGEDELNRVGIVLLDAEQFDDAILVFELNISEYPKAWNTYDSLAYAHMLRGAEGDRELAIENYEEALRRNPRNEDAQRYLAELRGQAGAERD